jgi:hypothetical protein
MTIFTYLPSDTPLMPERITFGAAAVLTAVLGWFSCCNAVLTWDKFADVFARIISALSLVLSMALCFAPKLKVQIKAVTDAQRCIGHTVCPAPGRQSCSRSEVGAPEGREYLS